MQGPIKAVLLNGSHTEVLPTHLASFLTLTAQRCREWIVDSKRHYDHTATVSELQAGYRLNKILARLVEDEAGEAWRS